MGDITMKGGDRRVRYWREGEQPGLHGFYDDARAREALARFTRAGYRAIVVDLEDRTIIGRYQVWSATGTGRRLKLQSPMGREGWWECQIEELMPDGEWAPGWLVLSPEEIDRIIRAEGMTLEEKRNG